MGGRFGSASKVGECTGGEAPCACKSGGGGDGGLWWRTGTL